MATIGQAFIEVHADTLPFDRELDRDLARAAKDAEKGLDRTGQQFGDKIADSTAKRLGQRGRDFGRSIENATKNVVVRVRSIFRFDRIGDSFRRFFRRDVGPDITDEIDSAISKAGRPGGPISKLGETLADAVGAGFNVSGRSPLIAILIPALLAIGGLIVAALQAVNALVAVLFIIPGLLASIGLQAGVLVIAFQGMGEAIQGAFAAKNAKELNEAIKNLTPSAQSFVRSLLPLRDLFREIGRTVQERFFSQLIGIVDKIRVALGPSLIKGFGDVAQALGAFARAFGELLASPGFVNFFKNLVPATVRWVDKFGETLFGRRGFITGMLAMATALMPFMQRFGDIVLFALDRLGYLMFRLTTNKDTPGWLDRMAATLQLVIDLAFNLGDFLFVFLKGLDEAGGAEVIEVISQALMELTLFLASPVGQKALEGIVDLAKFGIISFTGLLIAILAVIAVFEALAEALNSGFLPAITEAIRVFLQAIVDAATFLGVWIERIVVAIGNFFVWLGGIIKTAAYDAVAWVASIVVKIVEFIAKLKGIPTTVKTAFANFGSLLINSGRALIDGLINGIRQKIGPLLDLLNWIGSRIGGFFGNSPAIYGPLAGKGWTTFRGQNIIKGLIEGMESEIPALRATATNATSNITFGQGAVQVNFQGALPTESQARTVGSAVGSSAASTIAARNTRLAVRTM